MTRAELMDSLGTIARSGTAKFMEVCGCRVELLRQARAQRRRSSSRFRPAARCASEAACAAA